MRSTNKIADQLGNGIFLKRASPALKVMDNSYTWLKAKTTA